jgi:hypothetical protein
MYYTETFLSIIPDDRDISKVTIAKTIMDENGSVVNNLPSDSVIVKHSVMEVNGVKVNTSIWKSKKS